MLYISGIYISLKYLLMLCLVFTLLPVLKLTNVYICYYVQIIIIETARISILLGKEKKLSVRGCKWLWEKSRKVDNDTILFHQLEYVVMVCKYMKGIIIFIIRSYAYIYIHIYIYSYIIIHLAILLSLIVW